MTVYGPDLDLANRLRRWLDPIGVAVVEIAGWQTRGRTYATFNPYGSVNHHTADGQGDQPSLGICINGRSDLPGPLCHVHQARSDHVNLVAAGVANHAGPGGYAGLSGNASVFGLEVEHRGYADEPFSQRRWETSCRVHAAFLSGLSKPDPAKMCQHFEWSSQGKIDFVRALLPGGAQGMRDRVAQLLRDGPGGTTPPPPGEDDMLPPGIVQLGDAELVVFPGDGGRPWPADNDQASLINVLVFRAFDPGHYPFPNPIPKITDAAQIAAIREWYTTGTPPAGGGGPVDVAAIAAASAKATLDGMSARLGG